MTIKNEFTKLDAINKNLDDIITILNRATRSCLDDPVMTGELSMVGSLVVDTDALIKDLRLLHLGSSADLKPGKYEVELFQGYGAGEPERKVMALIKRSDVEIISISHSFLSGQLTILVAYEVIK